MDDSYYMINLRCRKAFLHHIAGHSFSLGPNKEFQFFPLFLKNKLIMII